MHSNAFIMKPGTQRPSGCGWEYIQAQLSEQNTYTGYAILALAQRVMSAGHGGQVLLSGATRELVRDLLPENTQLVDLGERRLKDLLRPEHLYQLHALGLPSKFPPPNTLDAFPNNLPVQLTTFIGREKEIAEASRSYSSIDWSP